MTLDRSNTPGEYTFGKPVRAGLVRVDPDNLEHAYNLYELLKQRTPEQAISHRVMPSFSEHVEFIRSRPYLGWWMIRALGCVYVGSIYLTRKRELGLFIDSGYQRQGHGGAAVREIMRMYGDDQPYLANINPKNEASIAFWKSLGFELLQVTYANAIHCS